LVKTERDQIVEDIGESQCSLFFDGTCHVAEVVVIGVRYLRGFRPQQKVLSLQVLKQSITAEELAAMLLDLTHDAKIREQVLAFHSDCASVNTASMKIILKVFKRSVWIGCLSHTLNNVGTRFECQTLDVFLSGWKTMLHSYKVREKFLTTVKEEAKLFSVIRWHSEWEICNQIYIHWDKFVKLIKDLPDDCCPESKIKMMKHIDKKILRLQLVVTVEVGMKLVKSTFNLEGDGALVLETYTEIRQLQQHFGQIKTNPQLTLLATRDMIGSLYPTQDGRVNAWRQVEEAYTPVLEYFEQKLTELEPQMNVFEAARLFNPVFVCNTKPNLARLDILIQVNFVSDDDRKAIASEWSRMLTLCEDYKCTDHILFYEQHEAELPNISRVVKRFLLTQPSSAMAERVLSILESVTKKQQKMLQDSVSYIVMRRYNNRVSKPKHIFNSEGQYDLIEDMQSEDEDGDF